jgi:polysaccharide export outer membrane protein
MRATVYGLAVFTAATVAFATSALAQTASAQASARPSGPSGGAAAAASSPATATHPAPPSGVDVPPGYVIGIQDEFDVIVWKDKDMSAEKVVVRPDGKISLPLVNDVDAVGLTVEQLRSRITEAASKYVTEPEISVVVKGINSRRVSITGQVAKPSQYALLTRMTVVELISMAGGVAEYANKKNIRITRVENGKTVSLPFNYKEFLQGKAKALAQNIELKPGDIVTVP